MRETALQDIHRPKMLEIVRRLTLATQQGILEWVPDNPKRKDHFKTEVAGKLISVKVEDQFAEVLVRISDRSGNPLVAVDSTLVRDQSERRLFVELMEAVRKKEEGIEDLLDALLAELLACLPAN